jgi:hypothetical protein
VKQLLDHELVVGVVGAEVPLQALQVGLPVSPFFSPIPGNEISDKTSSYC